MLHYVIVRSDLPVGVLVAQTIHAAGESAKLRAPEPDTHAVALWAPRCELEVLERLLDAAGVAFVAIREPDAPWCGELLAIGVAPARREDVAVFFRHLTLVGRRGPLAHHCELAVNKENDHA